MILAQQMKPTPASVDYVYEWSWWESLSVSSVGSVAAVAALAFVLLMTLALQQRERVTVSRTFGAFLVLLRLVAIAGIVVFLLGPQRRRAEQVTRPSRVVVLVDSSASMATPDRSDGEGQSRETRFQAAQRLLGESGLVAKLSKEHEVSVSPTDAPEKSVSLAEAAEAPLEWWRPAGAESRLGDALRETLDRNLGEPLAGIVLLSDGRSNAGEDPVRAAAAAAASGVTVMTVGFGADRVGANLLVREIIAPTQAFPDDELEITAVVEVTGERTGTPSFALYRRLADQPPDSEVLLETKQPPPKEDPEDAKAEDGPTRADASPATRYAVRFKTRPEATGRFVYSVRATPLVGETRRDDNRRETVVEVVDRETRVLIVSGGPGRDYRFLVNQLRRDDSFVVEERLQSASGAGGDVPVPWPETEQQLDEYDVLVALDPDWSSLTETQADLIAWWVSRRGGGLFFAPGPVHTPKWLQRGPPAKIEELLPVGLPERMTLMAPSVGSPPPARPRPVRLSRAGVSAEFLWIAGGREASAAAWSAFPGFYRVAETVSLRPGATVYASVATGDGSTDTPGLSGVVFAEQYFGAGRVFYCGVGELWRLRALDAEYFNALGTKLLRRLSQGRLAAKAASGRLVFERDRYLVGETLVLRAILPGRAAGADVRCQLIAPGGESKTLELVPSETRPDTWSGRLPATLEGRYAASIASSGAVGAAAPLGAETEVTAPALERDQPTRDPSVLTAIAKAGGGWYYPDPKAVFEGLDPAPPLVDAIPSRAETRTVFGQLDDAFAEQISRLLLGVICGSLLLHWLARRLTSLA